MERESHSRLRLRKREGYKYKHDFSESEIESLASICDALLPSIDPLSTDLHPSSDAVKEFFITSASETPLPDEIAEVVKHRALPEASFLVRAVLRVLSTRVGTLLLCGSLCFGKEIPFITKFSHLPIERREKILKRWSSSKYLFFLRLVFFFVKSVCLFLFVSQVDEQSNNNPAWEAMDYKVDETTHDCNSLNPRPLQQGIVETLYESPTTLIQSLTQKGLRVTEDPEKNLYKVECDVAIIGSGCGGAVAAAILASSGLKVIVLEKGNYYTASDYSLLEKPSMDELFEKGGMFTSADGSIALMAGTAVGGGSVVNWSACIKTPKEVLNEWAEKDHLSLFGSSQYAFAMDAVCKRIGVTENCAKEGLQNQVLRKGCENLGLQVEKVARNSSENHYCGSCQYGCRSADKQGADLTWLVDAVGCGCVIITGCKAEKLLFVDNKNSKTRRTNKKTRCIGVVAKSFNENITRRIQIEAQVTISACGALFTPPLLISSGLRNKHIGMNLHLHPAMMVWGYFPESDPQFEGKSYQGGLITSVHKVKDSEDGSERVRALVETPALGPSIYAAILPWESGHQAKERITRYSRTSHLFSMIRDQGSGEVKNEGRVTFRMSDLDKENMTVGLRRAIRILIAAGAEEVGTHRSDGQMIKCKGTKEEDLEEFIRSVSALNGPFHSRLWGVYSTAHQMGSCKMGATESEGAVDETGESWEAEGLFVCDGSVLPSAVGVNPMITIQSTAYCISKKIAESFKEVRFH